MLRPIVSLLLGFACALASPAMAGHYDAASARDRTLDPGVLTFAPRGMLEGIERVIDMRFAMIDQIAPLPAADSTDAYAVFARLSALQEMNAFVRQTVDGLEAAADDQDESALLKAEGANLMTRYQGLLGKAMTDLLDHPMVKSDGWFTISRFGEDTDRIGGLLMSEAVQGSALPARVLPRLKELRARGETAPYVLYLVSQLASQDP